MIRSATVGATLSTDRPTHPTWLGRRLRALKASAAITLLGIGPFIVGAAMLWLEGHRNVVAEDFRHAFLPAARALVHGASPYPAVHDPVVATGAAYVYPLPAALATTPFTVFPDHVAAWIVTALTIALVPLVLRALDVRDWRCYGAALLWAPVASTVQTVNLSLLVALGVALAWRYRGGASGAAMAITTALKLFTWPLCVWAYATGRRGRAVGAALGAVFLILGSWALVGFAGIGSYLSLVRRIDHLEAGRAYTLYALGLELGLGAAAAKIVWLAAGLGALAGCVVLGRRGDDRRSFVLAVAASLALSPIVWLHYFALLLVPLAISRPRFGPVWLLPIALWVVPADGNGRAPWQTVLTLAVSAAVVALSLLPGGALARRPANVPATA